MEKGFILRNRNVPSVCVRLVFVFGSGRACERPEPSSQIEVDSLFYIFGGLLGKVLAFIKYRIFVVCVDFERQVDYVRCVKLLAITALEGFSGSPRFSTVQAFKNRYFLYLLKFLSAYSIIPSISKMLNLWPSYLSVSCSGRNKNNM